MPMPPYPLYCYTKKCKNLAQYKIAARWSDGMQSELKTYGLCCEECLGNWYRRALEKQRACALVPGETLDVPGIYRVEHGMRDRQLQRLEDLEKKLA
jgi:hypothetical protein